MTLTKHSDHFESIKLRPSTNINVGDKGWQLTPFHVLDQVSGIGAVAVRGVEKNNVKSVEVVRFDRDRNMASKLPSLCLTKGRKALTG